ncbi:MBOAT family protein [Cellulomonas sp. Sa3CUA2]|uniref:MBOAT family protein n=1 Tax=Cellulomonas avistercoris TaxID=2762242 RepID=A0ABR8QIE5_9CELL|nr:MBOAT family O-acyltransferase [Cellulomonas avistercoris]MBD7920207.1 MBOAT family protein [Cellulomonas avistercoris]
MVFSSYLFVFGFLPAFLVTYYLLRPRFRNAFILLASLTFYYIGDKNGIVALIAAIVLNYAVGALMGGAEPEDPDRTRRRRRGLLVVGIVLNLAVLVWFKYIGLFTRTVDELSSAIGLGEIVPVIEVALPLGISFFVFQGISYLVDVYRGTIAPTRNFIVFGAYKSMFPQLIAGPIVRYRDVAEALDHRAVTDTMVFQGIIRFVTGFAKKVLLADTFAVTADAIFALPSDQLSTSTTWLGVIAYTLQIYFDFSAYSDMAIGMAMMMGFRFPENFNYPYISRSIREFWRRWHMTLSSWFRDYVYIPLGGSRAGKYRTYLNSLIVFMLTGLWHGAEWTFLVWGLWHGFFIVMERVLDIDNRRIPSFLRWAGTLGVVMVGWVLFRAESFGYATDLLAHMIGLGPSGAAVRPLGEFVNPWLVVTGVVAMVLSMPVYPWLKERLSPRTRLVLGWVVFSLLFVLASTKVLAGAYSPFLYFRF